MSVDWETVLPKYCFLMAMVKERLSRAGQLIQPNNSKDPVAYLLNIESAYLELRKICETVALGCLLVHGDVEGARTSALKSEWNAEKIIKRMAGLHDNFFPISVDQVWGQHGETLYHTFDKDEAINRNDLIAVYHQCQKALHMGNLIDLEKLKPHPGDPFFVGKSINGFTKLLENHRIELFEADSYLSVILSSKQNPGSVAARIFPGSLRDPKPL